MLKTGTPEGKITGKYLDLNLKLKEKDNFHPHTK